MPRACAARNCFQVGPGREPQPVGWLVADTADLASQHRVLVPEHQEFGILGGFPPGQHHQTAEQTTYDQVEDRKEHSGMIPAHNTGQARSSNRVPHGASRPPDLLCAPSLGLSDQLIEYDKLP